jgi:type I restriction enzyme, S subunit
MSEFQSVQKLIPDGWESKTIGDVAQLRQGLQISTSKRFPEYQKGRLPLLKITDLPTDSYSEYVEDVPANYIAHEDDIIYTRTGQVGLVYTNKKGVVHNNCFKVIIDEKHFDKYFFYYLLNSKKVNKYALAVASGSVQSDLTHTAFKTCPIIFPKSLQEQKSIGRLLYCLDCKIENLKKQNETLEAIAQTLFKHWFVDFEFPNEDGKPYKSSGGAIELSELGEIPTGWSVGKIGDFCNVKHGYAFKGEFITAEETGQILLTPGNFRIGGGFNSSKYKYYSDDDYDKDYILEAGDLIITMTDLSKEGDTLGYPAFVPKHGNNIFLHNQRIGKVIDSQIDLFFLFFLLCRREYRSHILGTASGSTVRHTSPSRILECKFTVPNKELLDNFSLVVSKLISKTFANYEQIETLSKTRDVLLPKLISGQLRII